MKVRTLSDRAAWEMYRAGVQTRWLLWDAWGAWPHAAGRLTTLAERRSSVPLPHEPFGERPAAEQSAALYRLSAPALIEPAYGYVITRRGQVVWRALVSSEFSRDRRRMHLFSGVPSLTGYAAALRGHRSTIRLPAVALMRHPYDYNYYHALVEVLPRLVLLEQCGVGMDVPLVISSALARLPMFEVLRRRGVLPTRRWLVQDDTYIEASILYAPCIVRQERTILDRFLELIDAPPASVPGRRRLFITRGQSVGRTLSNLDEIRPLLARYNLNIVDTACLSLDEQIDLFRDAQLVIGIHGAGLANILFRRGAPLSLIELFPPNYLDPGFYLLAKTYGYNYAHLVGETSDGGGAQANFTISAEKLEAKIQAVDA